MKKVSTTKLASDHLSIPSEKIWSALFEGGYIDERRNITKKGEGVGGETKVFNGTYYIAWPIDFDPLSRTLLGVNQLAKRWIDSGQTSAGITGRAINRVLLETGLIKKTTGGYLLTALGKKFGGIQRSSEYYGTSSVVWPEDFLSTSQAKKIESKLDDRNIIPEDEKEVTKSSSTKRKGQYKTNDGHWVASRGEVIIDNLLYQYYIPHSYDRALNILEEDGQYRCDFYIPAFIPSMKGPIHIEFWGLESDENYMKRKKEKLAIYKKYEFILIEIRNKDIQDISTFLERNLLKFGLDCSKQ